MKEKEIIKEYMRYLELRQVKTAPAYIVSVKEFLRFLEELDCSYKQVPLNINDEYKKYLLEHLKKYSHRTINNKLNRVKSFYTFLVKKNRVLSNPFHYARKLKSRLIIPKNILSVDEIGILLDNFSIMTVYDIMLKSLIEILYGSGLRISEALNLRLNDIDFDKSLAVITDFKDNEKRKKKPLTEISIRELKWYISEARDKLTRMKDREQGYIYPQKKSSTILCQLNRKLKNECKRLDLKTITSHSFRHCSATHLLRSGAGIREVQSFLGHGRIASTEVYTRVIKEDLKKVLNTYHPRNL